MNKDQLAAQKEAVEAPQAEAPKRKRRTKAEIEADKAAQGLDAAKAEKAAAAKAKREAKKAEAETAEKPKTEKVEKPKAAKAETAEKPKAKTVKVKSEPVADEPAKVEAQNEPVAVLTGADKAPLLADDKDIAGLTVEELCDTLSDDIQNMSLAELRTRVEQIKVAFYKLVRAKDETRRMHFIVEGGKAEDYVAETTEIEKRFKSLLNLYRQRRDSMIAASEEQKQANYKAKEAIIEELKALISSTETMGQTFAAFRELQNQWKEIGIVPLAQTKDLWETYHHHTENFYNFIKINKELRDIDLRRNMEAKNELCEQAEALFENPSPVAAFNSLQRLHDQYRETGPVPAEFKDQLWERFKAASARVNKRHQEHYDTMRVDQERNLALKGELCEKAEQFALLPLTSIKEWNAVQDQIGELQKVWKTIGFAPKKDNNKIYDRFRAACDKFFSAKRAFFGSLRSEMDDNLQIKTDLCVQAEALAASEDWKEATESILDLQKRWKESGTVSRKHADAVWKRFRAACDTFFERKGQHFKSSDNQYSENLTAKEAILAELQAMESSDSLTFDSLKQVMGRWSAIGFVPFKQKQAIADRYKKIVDTLFEILRKNEGSARISRYEGHVAGMRASDGGTSRGLNNERDKMHSKLRTLEAEIKLLENNIGFFAGTKSSFVAEVEQKIEKAKVERDELVAKIKLLKD